MSRYGKLLLHILQGISDSNVSFSSLRQLLVRLGFAERIRGSHHIYSKEGISEILNLQEREGGKAKPYQVKQVREVILKYRLGGEDV